MLLELNKHLLFFDFFSELGYSDVASVNARCQVNCHVLVIDS